MGKINGGSGPGSGSGNEKINSNNTNKNSGTAGAAVEEIKISKTSFGHSSNSGKRNS